MSESVRVDFLAHAKIKVPAQEKQEKQEYEDLIDQKTTCSVLTKIIWDLPTILSTKLKPKIRI